MPGYKKSSTSARAGNRKRRPRIRGGSSYTPPGGNQRTSARVQPPSGRPLERRTNKIRPPAPRPPRPPSPRSGASPGREGRREATSFSTRRVNSVRNKIRNKMRRRGLKGNIGGRKNIGRRKAARPYKTNRNI